MKYIEDLDQVLEYIGTSTKWDSLKEDFEVFTEKELKIILRKLNRDGYIDIVINNRIMSREYEIGLRDDMVIEKNLEGFLLCSLGGYKGKIERENSEKNLLISLEVSQQNLAKKLNTLTAWIAAGSIALVIMEIIKFVYEIIKNK